MGHVGLRVFLAGKFTKAGLLEAKTHTLLLKRNIIYDKNDGCTSCG